MSSEKFSSRAASLRPICPGPAAASLAGTDGGTTTTTRAPRRWGEGRSGPWPAAGTAAGGAAGTGAAPHAVLPGRKVRRARRCSLHPGRGHVTHTHPPPRASPSRRRGAGRPHRRPTLTRWPVRRRLAGKQDRSAAAPAATAPRGGCPGSRYTTAGPPPDEPGPPPPPPTAATPAAAPTAGTPAPLPAPWRWTRPPPLSPAAALSPQRHGPPPTGQGRPKEKGAGTRRRPRARRAGTALLPRRPTPGVTVALDAAPRQMAARRLTERELRAAAAPPDSRSAAAPLLLPSTPNGRHPLRAPPFRGHSRGARPQHRPPPPAVSWGVTRGGTWWQSGMKTQPKKEVWTSC